MTDPTGRAKSASFGGDIDHHPTPCTASPNGWLQNGENPYWATGDTSHYAASQCRHCARLVSCARAALSAGTVPGHRDIQVADGVVMAGVICTGDLRTRAELRKVIVNGRNEYHRDRGAVFAAPHPSGLPMAFEDELAAATELAATRPGATDLPHCIRCDRPFTAPDVDNPANAVTKATSDYCKGCYKAACRSGEHVPQPVPPRPTHCRACGKPMTTRQSPKPGHVTHSSKGSCQTCRRKQQRRAAAAPGPPDPPPGTHPLDAA